MLCIKDINQSYPNELEKGRALQTKQRQRLKRNGNTKPIRLGVKHDRSKQEEQMMRITVCTDIEDYRVNTLTTKKTNKSFYWDEHKQMLFAH